MPRNSVDLPAPLGPITASSAPGPPSPPHRQPHDTPQPGTDRDRGTKPGDHGHAQDRPGRRLRRMRRRRPMAVGVGVPVVMSMVVGMGVIHPKMLYYNIT